MTDFDSMPAGREMDALVAERVMGWRTSHRYHRVVHPDGREIGSFRGRNDCISYIKAVCPAYSTDVSAAWGVLEKIGTNGMAIINDDGGMWVVVWDGMQPVVREEGKPFCSTWFIDEDAAWAETVPLAICRAALKATEATL